ncbi:MAG TPA: YjbA family protein [Bacillaceae bacterium]
MLYLHDVWVNWFEGEENGYNVCHFHEWRRGEDVIELLDQVPLLLIEPILFHYIENNMAELPQAMLNDVYKKGYLRKNHERVQLDYCFVVTDGKGILAVDTIGYTIPLRKSRLIPRQEQLVYEMIAQNDPATYSCKYEPKKKEHHILSPDPSLMHGLTRRERQLKQLMFMALDQLHSAKNTPEIRYWYTEWSPHKYHDIQTMDFDEAWRCLYEETREGWTEKHSMLCENLVKGQPFFEKLWELECDPKVN